MMEHKQKLMEKYKSFSVHKTNLNANVTPDQEVEPQENSVKQGEKSGLFHNKS